MTFRFPLEDDADSPWPVFRRVAAFHEFEELRELMGQDVQIALALWTGPATGWSKQGRTTLGFCCMPSVQGVLRPLFDQMLEDTLGYLPDFMIVFNSDYWETASAFEREALMFHEAKHIAQARDRYGEKRYNPQTHLPILAIRPHDVEEFNEVVARYGAWKPDLVAFREILAGNGGPPMDEPDPGPAPAPEPEPVVEAAPEPADDQAPRDAAPQGESAQDVF